MSFTTSNISLTSRAQDLCLKNSSDCDDKIFINEIISRLPTTLLSPAAIFDFTFHTFLLPLSFIYAIGKSIYLRKADFILPWQHLQRIREAVFPILFGTIFGIIHPYLGIYAMEPKIKHIAGGFLLNNTSNERIQTLVSPTTSYEETIKTMKKLPKSLRFPEEYSKLTKKMMTWEKSLEKIQSIEIFDFKITYTLMKKLQNTIYGDKENITHTTTSKILTELVVRITLIAYPIFAMIDLIVAITVSSLLLITGLLQVFGAKSPMYLETTSSPVFHIYSLAKIIIGTIGLILGFFISFISPKHGLEFSYPSSKNFGLVSFLLKFQFLKLSKQIKSLKNNERLLLPVVSLNKRTNSELNAMPSHNSHMNYLLVEKINSNNFSAELISRDNYHGIQENLAELISRDNYHGIQENLKESDVIDLAKKCISLRFVSLDKSKDFLKNTFNSKKNIIDLGKQSHLNNCVITNLFAVFEVLNTRNKISIKDYEKTVKEFKSLILKKYNYFRYDFFPFTSMDVIWKEIEKLKDEKI